MNCEQVAQYLPGLAGDELGAETIRWVQTHVADCPSCRAESARYRSLASGLSSLSAVEIEPPALLAEAIAERVRNERRRRFLPVPPVVSPEIARAVTDNRDAIVSAGATLIAAGAAFALWRAARNRRTTRIASA
ncbi:MAG: anti-sigma factor family protein [Actinomycetota bacterium]